MPPPAVNETASAPPSQSRPAGWAHCLTLFLLFAAGTALRLVCAGCKPFWFDEAFSVEVARLDWRNFLHLMWWREANMSLYYVLLKVWLHFGQSPLFIRSFSAVISGATLPAIYWLAKHLYDRRVALIATALFAGNAYSIRYAQEARSYSLFLLLATLSSGLLLSWLRNADVLRSQFATSKFSNNPSWRYVTASVLAVYAHLYAILLILCHWIFVTRIAPNSTSRARSRIMRAWEIIGLAVLPLLIFVTKTGAGPIRWIQRPGIRDLFEFLQHLAGGRWPLLLIYVAACIAALAPAGKRLWTRNQSWEVLRTQFLLLWLALPIALTVLLSFARPVFLPRYMIFCLPPFLISVAAGLSRLRPWFLAPALAIILFLGFFQGTMFIYAHDYDDERDASGAATDLILDHTRPGDAIIFHIAETRVPYEFFRSLRAGTNTAKPDGGGQPGPEIVFPRHGSGLDYRDFTGKPTPELIRRAAQGHRRLWLMLMHNGSIEAPDPTTVLLSQILAESFPKTRRWQFSKVEVRLYSKE